MMDREIEKEKSSLAPGFRAIARPRIVSSNTKYSIPMRHINAPPRRLENQLKSKRKVGQTHMRLMSSILMAGSNVKRLMAKLDTAQAITTGMFCFKNSNP
jgi:hypothetical protein